MMAAYAVSSYHNWIDDKSHVHTYARQGKARQGKVRQGKYRVEYSVYSKVSKALLCTFTLQSQNRSLTFLGILYGVEIQTIVVTV